MFERRYSGSEIDLRIAKGRFRGSETAQGVVTSFTPGIKDGDSIIKPYATIWVAPDAPQSQPANAKQVVDSINSAVWAIHRDPATIKEQEFRRAGKVMLADVSQSFGIHPGRAEVEVVAAFAAAMNEAEPSTYNELARPIGSYATDSIVVDWDEIVEIDDTYGVVRLDTGHEYSRSHVVVQPALASA